MAYRMLCHRGSDERIYHLTSTDGKAWTEVSASPIVTLPDGVWRQRDPSVLFHNGYYWVAHTMANALAGIIPSNSFRITRSTDLTTWEAVYWKDVVCDIASVKHVWAPEWFVDPADDSVHIIVAIGTTDVNHQPYEVHPLDDRWRFWSTPTLITGAWRSGVIDMHIQKIGSTYHCFAKDERADPKYVEHYESSSLLSGWTLADSGDWAGWGDTVEAPCVIDVGSGTYRIYLDAYTGNGIFWSESSDDFATWTTPVECTYPGLAYVPAHPSVFEV